MNSEKIKKRADHTVMASESLTAGCAYVRMLHLNEPEVPFV